MLRSCIIAALIALPASSCNILTRTNPDTGQQDVNWQAVASEVRFVEADLRDASEVVADDPELAATLLRLADAAAELALVADMAADGEPVDALAALDLALDRADDVWEALSGEDLAPEARVSILLVRSTLRRLRGYAAPPGPHVPVGPSS